jgi:HD-like signal output (HDOD) protein
MLASKLRTGDPDETFTAGLLHDAGRLVLALRFKDEYWKAVGGTAETETIDTVEREHFGIDHAEVGGWMLEAWALPAPIVEAVRIHHGSTGRQTGPNVLAVTDRLMALTDLATGALKPEAEALLETTRAQGISSELWRQTLVQLRDGGTLDAFKLG